MVLNKCIVQGSSCVVVQQWIVLLLFRLSCIVVQQQIIPLIFVLMITKKLGHNNFQITCYIYFYNSLIDAFNPQKKAYFHITKQMV
jgi:hypothetical protein